MEGSQETGGGGRQNNRNLARRWCEPLVHAPPPPPPPLVLPVFFTFTPSHILCPLPSSHSHIRIKPQGGHNGFHSCLLCPVLVSITAISKPCTSAV